MTRKALLIGINYIGTNSQLNGCINDVINIQNFLLREKGYKQDEIVILTEVSNGKKPLKDNIINWINWLVQDNNEHSNLFFHYSGHGSNITDLNKDEVDGRDETICPLDYETNGFIIDDDLYKLLISPLKKGAKLMCIFDSCHSGTIIDLRYNYKVDSNQNNNTYQIKEDKNYNPTESNVIVFSGCLDAQYSADSFEEGKAQGALTYCFLKTYQKFKDTKKPITYKGLIKNLTVFMKQKKYDQIPQLSSGHFIDIMKVFEF